MLRRFNEQAAKATIDSASYDPYPPEGAVLHRQGAKLIPASVTGGHLPVAPGRWRPSEG